MTVSVFSSVSLVQRALEGTFVAGPIIPACRKLRQQNGEFEASLARPHLKIKYEKWLAVWLSGRELV